MNRLDFYIILPHAYLFLNAVSCLLAHTIYCSSFFFFPNAVESCSHSILLYPTRTSTIALVWLNFGGETLNGFEVIELIFFFWGGGGRAPKWRPGNTDVRAYRWHVQRTRLLSSDQIHDVLFKVLVELHKLVGIVSLIIITIIIIIIIIIKIPVFTLGSIYSTYASGAEQMTETNNSNQT